ncbi:MAG: siroheme synthase CysG [Rhodospirillaceae bacterium]|nr:siroheme synthase CysG [Rhodospirillaceae bacterium]
MSHLPAFFSLAGRHVLVVGGTPLALERARLARAAGAAVRLFAPHLSEEARQLVSEPGVAWVPGAPAADDFAAASLAFVATGDSAQDEAAAAAAKAAAIPVNVADRTDLCDFIMPAIIRRGDVTVGVSTGGAVPALARALRERIERVLPSRLGDLAQFAAGLRSRLKQLVPQPVERRRVWDRLLGGPVGEAVLAGRDEAAHRHLLALLNDRGGEARAAGAVHIVGAGPGDPDLLTLRALRLLQEADIVFYDDLIGPDLLDYARRDAERVSVGKQKGKLFMSQAAINAALVEAARAGKRVVRLKGGDPFVFGRGGEEVEELARHGIEASVVPGVTAALGCAAAAGIPLTHRDHASSVTFVTGHGRDGAPPADWSGLARADRTLVVYMGLSAAAEVSAKLVAAGLDSSTPVAIVQSGTRRDQRVSLGTLGALPALATGHRDGGPALIVVGAVAALADRTVIDADAFEVAA